MSWRFVDLPIVLALHTALIERSGGSPGLRDRGLLESAIARAENKVNYDEDATVASVGDSLSYGLIKNHAFIDGNKRIGLATLAVFLKLNGYVLTCSAEEEISAVLRVAAGEMTGVDGLGGGECGTAVGAS